jgi:hypothetical protein
VVVYTCNPSYSGGGNLEDHSLRPNWSTISGTPISTNTLVVVGSVCGSTYTGGENRRLVFQATRAKHETLFKNN